MRSRSSDRAAAPDGTTARLRSIRSRADTRAPDRRTLAPRWTWWRHGRVPFRCLCEAAACARAARVGEPPTHGVDAPAAREQSIEPAGRRLRSTAARRQPREAPYFF